MLFKGRRNGVIVSLARLVHLSRLTMPAKVFEDGCGPKVEVLGPNVWPKIHEIMFILGLRLMILPI
jgi:hypothetical protein